MKNYKVNNLRTHLGGVLGKTSYDAQRDECDMEVWPVGVLIKTHKGKEVNLLVPYPNVVEAQVIVTSEAPAELEQIRRRPGRPPKDIVA